MDTGAVSGCVAEGCTRSVAFGRTTAWLCSTGYAGVSRSWIDASASTRRVRAPSLFLRRGSPVPAGTASLAVGDLRRVMLSGACFTRIPSCTISASSSTSSPDKLRLPFLHTCGRIPVAARPSARSVFCTRRRSASLANARSRHALPRSRVHYQAGPSSTTTTSCSVPESALGSRATTGLPVGGIHDGMTNGEPDTMRELRTATGNLQRTRGLPIRGRGGRRRGGWPSIQ